MIIELRKTVRIEKVILENSYMVQSIQGTSLPRALTESTLKDIILVLGKMHRLDNDQ
jgi:hypothetical protein